MPESIRTSYKKYKESEPNPLSLQQYIRLTADYILFLMDKVFDNEEVTLPHNMGSLSVQGIKEKVHFDEEGKIKGLSPNWRLTKELWEKDPTAKENKKLIFNTNEHTNGIRYKFLWSKKRIIVPFKTVYALRMSKDNKKKLFAELQGGKEYNSKSL